MTSYLLEHIDTLATFDAARRVLRDGWLLIEEGKIAALGAATDPQPPLPADAQRLDLRHYVVLPGMISTHHHNFQTLLRNIPSMQNASLFPWLHDLYLLMSEVHDEDQWVATMVAHAELLLSGCTTSVDHSYLKVNDMRFETEIAAAQEMGIRFHLARGSFSIGQSQGGLPPDHIVEREDDILADTERLIRSFHDPAPGAMVRIDNAPCSPFSVSERVMTESIALARRYGVGNHTHLAENMDDHRYVMERFGMSSVRMAESLGWVGPDVWYAHGVVLDEDDMDIMARTGTGIAHCPCSNQFLASGVCKVTPLLKRGVKIGMAVDGSASNNSSNMLDEVRAGLLLQRVTYGAEALAPTQALEMATLGSAQLLRRDDIGVLAVGKAADLIGIDTRKLAFAGGLHDPLAALVLCASGQVDLTMVNGRLRVQDGQLLGCDLEGLIAQQNRLAADLVARTEARYGVSLGRPVWRRAFPYEAAGERL